MGVYIKNMDMPKSCGYCPLRHEARDGDECYLGASLTEYQKCPEDCPLLPVPPHGRLIDVDEAIGHLFNGEQCLYSWDEIEDAIDATETIIPALEDE